MFSLLIRARGGEPAGLARRERGARGSGFHGTRRTLANIALSLSAVCAAAGPLEAFDVTATQLDGTTTSGNLQQWEDDAVVISTPEGTMTINTDELLSLRWSQEPGTSVSRPPARYLNVELTDGTLIPANRFAVSASTATITPAAPPGAQPGEMKLNRRQLAAVHLQELDPAATAQWDEIRDLSLASDVLVLLKRDGKSLDYVEGVLGDVSEDKIEFKLEGELRRIDRAKVAGFIYYRRDEHDGAEPKFTLKTRSGLQANVLEVRLVNDDVHLKTAAGVTLGWPAADLLLADYSAGKLVYLSDLEPASERWTPLVALPEGAALAAQYGQPRRDQSAHGGPLVLSAPHISSTTGANQTFSKGLALRSRTELVYRLTTGFQRLLAVAGIDPSSSASGHVRLQILGDDRPLLETDIAGHQPPQPIELDIAGVKRLKIVVDYGQNLDSGDWLNLCDARIVK